MSTTSEQRESRFYQWMKPHACDVDLRVRSEFYAVFRMLNAAEQITFLDHLEAIPFGMRHPLIAFIGSGADPDGEFLAYLDSDESPRIIIDLVIGKQVKRMQWAFSDAIKTEKAGLFFRKSRIHQNVWPILWFVFIIGLVFGTVIGVLL